MAIQKAEFKCSLFNFQPLNDRHSKALGHQELDERDVHPGDGDNAKGVGIQ